MEPNRFDDVGIRIVEEPAEPAPKRRRLGPAALAITAALALTGSLAAGASALTSTAQAPTRATESSTLEQWGHERDGWCDKSDDRRRSSSAAVNY